jgi:hypothetical protein
MILHDINLNRLLAEYLSPNLRKVKNLQFLTSMIFPLRTLAIWFKEYQEQKVRESNMFGSTLQLEWFCNKFSFAGDAVYIVDGPDLVNDTYIFREIEEETTYIRRDGELQDTIYIRRGEEVTEDYRSFYVALSESDYEDNEIRNNIENIIYKYKVIGFSHKIVKYI